jgi:hypothetical protein
VHPIGQESVNFQVYLDHGLENVIANFVPRRDSHQHFPTYLHSSERRAARHGWQLIDHW